MKNMVILIDTNVALDFLALRQPYYDDAREVIRICADEQIQGYIAFHSLPNIFYVLRKSYSEDDRHILATFIEKEKQTVKALLWRWGVL